MYIKKLKHTLSNKDETIFRHSNPNFVNAEILTFFNFFFLCFTIDNRFYVSDISLRFLN